MKDFALSFLVVHAIWSIYRIALLTRRLDLAVQALNHLAAATVLLGLGKPPEKKP
jgi:hypothetical protein